MPAATASRWRPRTCSSSRRSRRRRRSGSRPISRLMCVDRGEKKRGGEEAVRRRVGRRSRGVGGARGGRHLLSGSPHASVPPGERPAGERRAAGRAQRRAAQQAAKERRSAPTPDPTNPFFAPQTPRTQPLRVGRLRPPAGDPVDDVHAAVQAARTFIRVCAGVGCVREAGGGGRAIRGAGRRGRESAAALISAAGAPPPKLQAP